MSVHPLRPGTQPAPATPPGTWLALAGLAAVLVGAFSLSTGLGWCLLGLLMLYGAGARKQGGEDGGSTGGAAA